MYLSVILPSFNEIKNIQSGVLEEVYSYLLKQDYSFELILSDDGSRDGTVEALQAFAKGKPQVRVLANAHRTKGPTVISGLLVAKGEYRLFSDFDQATPISEVAKLLAQTPKHDVVIGSREGKGASRKKEPFHRHLMGRVFNAAVQSIALPGIWDTQCGFKLFSAQAAKELCPKVVVYGESDQKGAFTGAFDVELLYLAQKFGYSIAEVPVSWKYVKTNRVDPIKDSIHMFIDILRIRLADMQGKYDSKK
ncbi:glycosyl transferase [Candidatus Cerribacteria bacterium 'Amazon FNV 2010 28 9']|uniref:Glycosyl transferase n=1 Tax=Candidatus Cerribacteria bacterium 'Amazon FNV 2010 28 9' TaxID=2081795 RepID=A0A317JV28_9BACT|nr:MAG: glycosyl transferase [Candidatus Cerribacteria bacterium 'Amazon FNV 2010 28 9']